MVTYSALAALLVAMLITIISVSLFRRRGPWGSGWTMFLVLFLVLWAVSLYVRSFGPIYLGVAWFPIIIVGILLALLFAAVLPDANHWRDESLRETKSGRIANPEGGKPNAKVGKLYWVLIIMLVVFIVMGMINPQMAL
ncbi:MAG TPA: hypothetical protein VD927_02050 [Chryseosolibacter sp.]|nr:hypothetical protein [Chryseosolibacter sp.]